MSARMKLDWTVPLRSAGAVLGLIEAFHGYVADEAEATPRLAGVPS